MVVVENSKLAPLGHKEVLIVAKVGLLPEEEEEGAGLEGKIGSEACGQNDKLIRMSVTAVSLSGERSFTRAHNLIR